MEVAGLLTSAGINIAICVVLFSLYSVLRKQPSNRIVYFGRRLASARRYDEHFSLERFVPSPGWIVKAWKVTEEEILAVGGMDAVALQRGLIFSIRIFSIATVVCMFLVIPVNYHGQFVQQHKHISEESLDVFSIGNVEAGSRWLWVHCLALYIISISACILLYFEYRSLSKIRLEQIAKSPSNPSHFTILVRAIPWSPSESYSDTVRNFFADYYASTYLSHQMVYRQQTIKKLIHDAEKMCHILKDVSVRRPHMRQCCFCGGATSFSILSGRATNVKEEDSFSDVDLATEENERPAAFVFFKSRYAAAVATQMNQSSNPMLWVTELAPEPQDVLWSSLSIRYRQLWLRKIATILVTAVFMFLFLIPVTFVQGLTQLDKLSRKLPFLRGLLKQSWINHVVTGYLPSVILMLFLYTVPPTMSLLSSVEGFISRSKRKKSTCKKILFFYIWNVFVVNILSGTIIDQLSALSSMKDIPAKLAKAIPSQASFFMTYVLSSGWASIGCEVMQLFPLLCNVLKKLILRKKEDSNFWLTTFPYHTEITRVLLFGLLGFTCAIMAPLILPFLLVYFVLAYLVYRNQILNVYTLEYDTGGKYWPIIHNTTIFSLILTQIIALGVFGIKKSPVASGFTIPLIFFTVLFNEYCRQRYYPLFQKDSAQVLIELDRRDRQSGTTEEIYQQLYTAYRQFPLSSHELCETSTRNVNETVDDVRSLESSRSGQGLSEDGGSWAVGDLREEKPATK